MEVLTRCFEILSPELSAVGLAPYFPPSTAVPVDFIGPSKLVAEMFLELFKKVNPGLRRGLIAYGMPALRREWDAFHPILVPNGLLLLGPDVVLFYSLLVPDGTFLFNKTFEPVVEEALSVLTVLLLRSSPARRRAADDVVLLDALVCCIALGSPVVPLFFQDADSNSVDAEEAQIWLDRALGTLRMVLFSHPKPYQQYVRTQIKTKTPSSLALVENYWIIALHRCEPDNFLPTMLLDPATPQTKLYATMLRGITDLMLFVGDFKELSAECACTPRV